MNNLTEQELARLHLECLYELDVRGRMLAVREADGGPPPRFAMVRTPKANLSLVRHDLPDTTAERLLSLAATEPVLMELENRPSHFEAYLKLLEMSHENSHYSGPAYLLPDGLSASADVVRVTLDNAHLLDRHFPGPRRNLTERSPIFVVVEDGVAISICESARQPSFASEAGVMTVEGYRRRGYAVKVVSAWAESIRAEGRLPLYSTWWSNTASQAVATRLGARLYGVDFSLE